MEKETDGQTDGLTNVL